MHTENKTLPNGYIVNVMKNSDLIINEIWIDKCYEKDFKINSNMIILDLGANQGLFSLYALSKGAFVYSYEPDNNNYSLLKENIKLNNLENKNKSFPYAVSTKNGTIDLYSPGKNKTANTALISTSGDYITGLQNIDNYEVEHQQVKTISLEKILSGLNNIDLLKIDCEGAELDILKSASFESLKKVKNIVMEIHKAYSQEELFFKMKSLGFNITAYEKISGLFQAGYLFATRKPVKNVYNKPIALFDIEQAIPVETEIVLDASNSFLPKKTKTPLEYSWFVNNKLFIKTNKTKYVFIKPGNFIIKLNIIHDNKEDNHENNVFITSSNYNKNKTDYLLKEEDKHKRVILKKDKVTYFKISKDSLPKDWNAKYRICLEYPENTVSKKYKDRELSGLFSFNEKEKKIKGWYQEFLIEDFPSSLDIIFSITSNTGNEIDVFWYLF